MLDVNIILKIAAIGIAVAVLNQILARAGREEMGLMVSLAGVLIVLFLLLDMIAEFFATVKTFLEF